MNVEELKNSLATLTEQVNKAQDTHTRFEEFSEGLDNETLKKALADSSQLAQDHQNLKQQMEAQDAELKRVEKLLSRSGNGQGQQRSEEESKARFEAARYLKTNNAVSQESLEYIGKGIMDPMRDLMSEDQFNHHVKTLVGSIPAQGGFFVRPELSNRMITRIFETSPMRNFSAVETITGDVLDIIIDDNELTAGGWVGETQSRSTTSTPDIGLKQIPVHEQFAQPAATQRMLDDAGFDIEGWISRKVTSKMSRDENTAFVVGDGNGKPRGFLTYPAWTTPGTYERGAIEQIASGGAAGVPIADDFKKMQNSMIEEYQNGAVWAMKRASFENVITLKDTTGRYIFQSRFINERDDMTLLGKPVVFFNDMPDVASNTLSYAYGNFSMGYTIVDRTGFRVIRDEVTSKPNVLFYTTKRTGGDVTNYESIKILKGAA